jgi:hypothetical protein
LEQWISVLGLSTQWEMTRIRTLAIKSVKAALAPDDHLAHRLLNLGQEYRVDEWVIASIVFFIKRKEPMGLNDVEIIGIENVLKIASLRESCVQYFQVILVGDTRKLVGEIADTKRIKQVFGLSNAE